MRRSGSLLPHAPAAALGRGPVLADDLDGEGEADVVVTGGQPVEGL
jgi:hypothetical protein